MQRFLKHEVIPEPAADVSRTTGRRPRFQPFFIVSDVKSGDIRDNVTNYVIAVPYLFFTCPEEFSILHYSSSDINIHTVHKWIVFLDYTLYVYTIIA